MERLALLDIYQSQRHVMVWIGKLETKIVPYHQHLLNRSDLLVGCKHPDGVIHLLAKLCKSWINPSLAAVNSTIHHKRKKGRIFCQSKTIQQIVVYLHAITFNNLQLKLKY